jgi:hypothetical protein
VWYVSAVVSDETKTALRRAGRAAQVAAMREGRRLRPITIQSKKRYSRRVKNRKMES